MINSVILVGRLVETPTLKNYEGEFSVTTINLAVTRPFKNSEGEYDTDFIRCVLWDGIAKSTCDYCRKGDIIAVRGRLNTKSTDVSFNNEGVVLKKKINIIEVVAERVVFIMTSGKKINDEKEELE